MSEAWLTRARLRRDARIGTLAPLLLPQEPSERVASGHRLMWSLFTRDGEPAPRDFLWRETRNGEFYVLSRRAPIQEHPVLEVEPPRPFAPSLAPGDRLRFVLRANATTARPLDSLRTARRDPSAPPRRRTAHDDVVMRALHGLPVDARADSRRRLVEEAGSAWLERQGTRHGFSLANGEDGPRALRVDGYEVLRPPRAKRAAQMRIGVLEFEGVLTVTSPAEFVAAVLQGFGRAKAFGCGLMLIARG